ncbi:hypothetical protein ACWCOT_11970 [Nonomuraea bangladeshensis]
MARKLAVRFSVQRTAGGRMPESIWLRGDDERPRKPRLSRARIV